MKNRVLWIVAALLALSCGTSKEPQTNDCHGEMSACGHMCLPRAVRSYDAKNGCVCEVPQDAGP